MTRSLTGDTTTQKNADDNKPYCLAKLEIGGAVGTKWLADCKKGSGDASTWDNADARITSWGTIASALAETGQYTPVGDVQIVIDDKDRMWHGHFHNTEFQGQTVTIYQHFQGLLEADLLVIFKGTICDAPHFDDSGRLLTLRLRDFSRKFSKTLGNLAHKDDFSGVLGEHTDAMLPVVFGEMKRSPCIGTDLGPMCRLIRRCTWSHTKLFVDNSSAFPQNTPITIRIHNEIIEGSFAGNTFTATQRAADLVTDAIVDAPVDQQSFDDLALSANSATYVGYWVKIVHADINHGFGAYRRIIGYDGTKRRVTYEHPPFIEEGVGPWVIPKGTVYSITSEHRDCTGMAHDAGSLVYYSQSEYVYVIADHPCKAVDLVEGYGRTRAVSGDGRNTIAVERDDYLRIEPDWYTVNTNDARYSSILGHNVTTLSFGRLPQEFLAHLSHNKLWADVDGAETAGDGSGTVIENPSDVVKQLLTRGQWGGLSGSDYDSATFVTAKTITNYLNMAFAITEQRDILDVVADLAWQARCALNWKDGIAHLDVLWNKMGTAAATLTANDFDAERRITQEFSSIEDVASELNAIYHDRLERKTVLVKDASVEAALGRRKRERDFWAFRIPNYVKSAAIFWLNRWKNIYEIARLHSFLDVLELEAADTISIDYVTLFPTPQEGTIRAIDHHIGSGEGGRLHQIDLTVRLPVMAGCPSTCEVECETGCETGCEFVTCQIGVEACWQCETACEEACEITGCTTSTEMYCGTSDAGCGEAGPCGACETDCTTGCELGGCETGCETGCEACETGCEVTCETGCELACQTCETGCETVCETGGCETSCETGGCETSCETGGCEVSCETGAECRNNLSEDFNFETNPLVNADWTTFDWHSASGNLGWFTDGAYVVGETYNTTKLGHGRINQHDMCSDDMEASMTIIEVPSGAGSDRKHALALTLRMNTLVGADPNRYTFEWSHSNLDDYPYLKIYKFISSARTLLSSYTGSDVPTSPSTIEASVLSQTLTIKVDTKERSCVDSAITSGLYAGFAGYIRGYEDTATFKMDDWSATAQI